MNSCVPAAVPGRHKQEQRHKTLLMSSVAECSDPKQQRGHVKSVDYKQNCAGVTVNELNDVIKSKKIEEFKR